jgi:hypothetical protein
MSQRLLRECCVPCCLCSKHVSRPPALRAASVDRTIARLNVERFRKLLAAEKDEAKRRADLCLLADEQAKLAALDKPPVPTDKGA